MCDNCVKSDALFDAVKKTFCDYAEEHNVDGYSMLEVAERLHLAVYDSFAKAMNKMMAEEGTEQNPAKFNDKEEPFNQMIFRTDSRKERLN